MLTAQTLMDKDKDSGYPAYCGCATPGSPNLDSWHSWHSSCSCCWCDAALLAAPLHLPPTHYLNLLVHPYQLPVPLHTSLLTPPHSLLRHSLHLLTHCFVTPFISCVLFIPPSMLPHLSLSISLSTSLAARAVPDCGMNSQRHLVWTQPGTGNPLRVFRVYELPTHCTMHRGADHQGRSLRVVDNVISRELL